MASGEDGTEVAELWYHYVPGLLTIRLPQVLQLWLPSTCVRWQSNEEGFGVREASYFSLTPIKMSCVLLK